MCIIFLHGGMTMATAISDLYTSVTIIYAYKGDEYQGSATGFFFENIDKLFLVTNKHVVLDEKKSYKPDTFKLILHTDASNTKKNEEFIISLYKNSKKVWLEHNNSNVDIAVITPFAFQWAQRKQWTIKE